MKKNKMIGILNILAAICFLSAGIVELTLGKTFVFLGYMSIVILFIISAVLNFVAARKK